MFSTNLSLRPRSLSRLSLLPLLFGCLTAPANAADLTFAYADPIGDFTGTMDVTSMVVVFNNITGNYKITVTTTQAQPFLGEFRVNVNLFNPSRLPAQSVLSDAVNDYNLTTPRTKLILKGTDANLLSWSIGDQVATNDEAGLGVPPGIVKFRSAVGNFPLEYLTNEDTIAFGPSGVATIATLTAPIAAQGLSDDVQVLLESGVLTAEQAKALNAKLTALISSLNRGGSQSACGQLNAFINQVNAFINSGSLPLAQGNELIQTAEGLRTSLGCS